MHYERVLALQMRMYWTLLLFPCQALLLLVEAHSQSSIFVKIWTFPQTHRLRIVIHFGSVLEDSRTFEHLFVGLATENGMMTKVASESSLPTQDICDSLTVQA